MRELNYNESEIISPHVTGKYDEMNGENAQLRDAARLKTEIKRSVNLAGINELNIRGKKATSDRLRTFQRVISASEDLRACHRRTACFAIDLKFFFFDDNYVKQP